jgi:chromosome segregation ATPase
MAEREMTYGQALNVLGALTPYRQALGKLEDLLRLAHAATSAAEDADRRRQAIEREIAQDQEAAVAQAVEREAERQDLEQAIARLKQAWSGLSDGLGAMKAELTRITADRDQADRDLTQLRVDHADVMAELIAAREALAAAKAEREAHEAAAAEAEAKRQAADEARAEAVRKIRELE